LKNGSLAKNNTKSYTWPAFSVLKNGTLAKSNLTKKDFATLARHVKWPVFSALKNGSLVKANTTTSKSFTWPVFSVMKNGTLAKNSTNSTKLVKMKSKGNAVLDGSDADEGRYLHWWRHEAWNEGHLNSTDGDQYQADSPAAYVVDPLELLARRARTDPTLHFYRHESWNEANNNATHNKDYQADSPAAGYLVPPLE
jgi:hypothetical protein